MADWVSADAVWSLIGKGLQILIAAGLSAFLAIKIVNRAKTKSDHADKRIDDTVSDIRTVSDLASTLWLAPAGPTDLMLLETKISTRVRQIEEMRVLAAATAPELLSDEVARAASRFGRALTGGDFGVHNRQASLDNARNCQHAASRYIAAIRKARFEALH